MQSEHLRYCLLTALFDPSWVCLQFYLWKNFCQNTSRVLQPGPYCHSEGGAMCAIAPPNWRSIFAHSLKRHGCHFLPTKPAKLIQGHAACTSWHYFTRIGLTSLGKLQPSSIVAALPPAVANKIMKKQKTCVSWTPRQALRWVCAGTSIQPRSSRRLTNFFSELYFYSFIHYSNGPLLPRG